MSIAYGATDTVLNRSITTALSGLPTSNLVYAIDANRTPSYSGGATITDLKGSAVTSTFTNGTYWEAGDLSNNYISSFVFDGSNDIITLANGANTGNPIYLTCPWTCHFWVKTATDSGLFSHYSGGPVNNGMYISSGKLAYAYYDGQWNYVYSPGQLVNNNKWNMLSYTCPASTTGTMKMYVNGALDHSFNPRITWGGYNMGGIGSLWGFQYMNGRLSTMQVYNTEHSATDVLSIYNVTRKKFKV
jgi:hypothetical protein